MEDFLITSSICLFSFLAVYHLFLEREKMHRFNRFYLLFSILISFVIPFISIEIIREIPPQLSQVEVSDSGMQTVITEEKINYLPWILGSVYGLVTLFLTVRFGKNIAMIFKKMRLGKRVPFENATLVLLEETTLPHTFLNTIFINETDYNNRDIETELFAHELTHVTQKHTLDVLFVETLKTIFWFNPIFFFYKKAIQLNHEFLADEKALESCEDIPFYQALLLSKAAIPQLYPLASNLNYSITKKRLIMMTKTTSKVKTVICQMALIPIITALVLLFCVKVNAQEKTTLSAEPVNIKSTDKDRDRYYSGVHVIAKNTDGSVIVDKKYEQLTKAEKDRFLSYVPKKTEKKSLTTSQFEDFKNATKHAIWIDDKNVPNANLSNYKSSDFVSFSTSSVFKNARSKKFPQPFQSNLYTNNYFNKNLKDSYKKFSGDTVKITVGKYNDFGLKKKQPGKKIKAELIQVGDSMYIKKWSSKSDIYTAVEIKPDFPGGMQEFYKYVASNFIISETFKGSGKIVAQFIVEKDGSLSEIKILKELGSGTGEEALRVLKQSPKWKPGIQNGEPVRVLYSLPISISAAE